MIATNSLKKKKRFKFRMAYGMFILAILFLSLSIYEVTQMEFEETIVLCEDNTGNEIVGSECIKDEDFSDAFLVLIPGIIAFIVLMIGGFFVLFFEKKIERDMIDIEIMKRKIKKQLQEDGFLPDDVYEIK